MSCQHAHKQWVCTKIYDAHAMTCLLFAIHVCTAACHTNATVSPLMSSHNRSFRPAEVPSEQKQQTCQSALRAHVSESHRCHERYRAALEIVPKPNLIIADAVLVTHVRRFQSEQVPHMLTTCIRARMHRKPSWT